MSINRIDFQGAFVRTGDVGSMKAAEDNRPQTDQTAFQVQFEKEKERESESVQGSDESRQGEGKFDAREKGRNEYQRREQQKKKKEEQGDEGGIIDLSGKPVGGRTARSAFDLKI